MSARLILFPCLFTVSIMQGCCSTAKILDTRSDSQILQVVDEWFDGTTNHQERLAAIEQPLENEELFGPIAINEDGSLLYLPIANGRCGPLVMSWQSTEGLLLQFTEDGRLKAWYRLERPIGFFGNLGKNVQPVFQRDGVLLIAEGQLDVVVGLRGFKIPE